METKTIDKTLNVLMIEYSELIGKRIKELVSINSSFNFLGQAKKITEGILLSAELNPDIIFLDIRMVEGDIKEVFSFLKKSNPLLKIIVFSFFDNELQKRNYWEMGADYFLDKSKDIAKIPLVLNSIVSHTRKQTSKPYPP